MPKERPTNAGPMGKTHASSPIPTLREPRYSQSLERGLAVLRCFAPARPVLGILDMAEELGMSRSTTHRYVLTLTELGYLEQQPSRKYRLSNRAADVGMSALNSSDLRQRARPTLKELHECTACDASLAVLNGGEIVYLDHVSSFHSGLNVALGPGSRLPVDSTAIGRLLLAYLPEEKQRLAFAKSKLTSHVRRAIPSVHTLREEFAQIRQAGYAVVERELGAERFSIAAPVRDEAGDVVAAVGVTAEGSTISAAKLGEELSQRVISAADAISARVGDRRDSD
jgi:IclR family transcriptional regulator, pca regulon regulatory protein